MFSKVPTTRYPQILQLSPSLPRKITFFLNQKLKQALEDVIRRLREETSVKVEQGSNFSSRKPTRFKQLIFLNFSSTKPQRLSSSSSSSSSPDASSVASAPLRPNVRHFSGEHLRSRPPSLLKTSHRFKNSPYHTYLRCPRRRNSHRSSLVSLRKVARAEP